MSRPMTWVSTVMTRPLERRLAYTSTPTPVTNIASVESMNGAPRIAPTPMACAASELSVPANRIAMSGIMVSGRAVPTAASTLPTAPSARLSLCPNHSIPFVKSSAAIRMTTSATASSSNCMALGAQVLRRVRQQRNVARALERYGQLALVFGTGARLATWLDLGALRQVAAQAVDLLVVDQHGLVGAEGAHLPAAPVAIHVIALLAACSARGHVS